jgi:hypothetical protein
VTEVYPSHRIVVTLPIDLTSRSSEDLAGLEESGTRGRYLSIEHVQEIDGGAIEWRKVACRDPGGMIPKFWVQRHMAQVMAEVIAVALSTAGDLTSLSCLHRRIFLSLSG